MKKLKSIIDEIGFRDRMDKEVDDESKAEFQDFGEYVGKLYQSFQDKDLKSKPEVAQKIRDLVSVEDESVLIQKVKDLEFLINQLPDKPESTEKMGFRQRNEQEQGPSYNEVWLKDKLGNPVKDVYEFNNNNGHMTIYPDLGNSKYKGRSSQFIRFELKEGEVHFVSAFGYEVTYNMLKNVLSELPPMGNSSYAGMMTVMTDEGTIPVGIDTANKMIDALKSGSDAEAGAQSDFYGKRGSTSGTVDEVESEDDTEFTVSLKHLLKKHVTKGGKIDEQSSVAQSTYERGLKRLQKSVLRYQLRYIEKQRGAALSQASTASSQASKGFDDQIKALADQIAAIDNPKPQEQNENILQQYINERKDIDLMRYMDSYKRETLLEGTIKKFFKLFEKGKTNEEVLKHYIEKGIKVPEQLLSKIRKQYENFKKLKLELDFSEQEAKDVVTISTKPPDIQLFDMGDEDKKLSSRLYKEQKITKKYSIPPEIKDALVNTLKMNPLIRFVKGLKAVNSIPPSYRIFLINGQHFDIIYEDFSLMAKIGIDEYYLDDLEEKNYAVKHINRLMTKPILKKQGEEENEEPDDTKSLSTSKPSSPSPPPSTKEPKEPEEA